MRLPRCGLSDLAQEVLVIVTRLAEGRIAMPSYPVLGAMASNRGRQSVAKAFDRLVNLGIIRMEFRAQERRALVVGIGRFTGWGEWIEGHAPNTAPYQAPIPEPGEAAAALPTPAQSEKVSPMTETGPPAPAEIVHRAPAPGPARQCQFIIPDPRVRAPNFCGARSLPGKSWCEEHNEIVFRRIPGRPSF